MGTALKTDQARVLLHAIPANDALVERYAEALVPTARGALRMIVFREKGTEKEHVAIVKGEVRDQREVPVRVHSECITGEIFGSLKCDCREQLDRARERLYSGHSAISFVVFGVNKNEVQSHSDHVYRRR